MLYDLMTPGDYIFMATFSEKARAIFDLVKPELPIAAGICVVAGQIIASGTIPTAFLGLNGFLTGFFISGAAMISNDYFDIEVDRINSPKRPLPSGRVTKPEVVILTCLFSIAGFLSAALLGLPILISALILWAVSILYNWRFKESGLPGHLMVAFCVASTFVMGGITAGGLMNGMIWAFGAMAFLFDLGEEIANSAMDMEGDSKRSARTFARSYGRKNALRVATLLFISIVVLSCFIFIGGLLGTIYLILFVPLDIALLYLALKLLKSKTVDEGHAKTRQLYLTMTLFIVAFIAISIL
jgi:geranylgeranylglycerol-phosphate geranylgeranyltransferase